ncbi:HNH endonuclease [Paenibacillus chartarius]|uniref:HNH endonuclease n=1 Tax=Paenibacillus chartarius TaxID=747481 RepID=A0ABV6DLD9_9BACL
MDIKEQEPRRRRKHGSDTPLSEVPVPHSDGGPAAGAVQAEERHAGGSSRYARQERLVEEQGREHERRPHDGLIDGQAEFGFEVQTDERQTAQGGGVLTVQAESKLCVHCGQWYPLSEFKRRTGRRSGRTGRRGACRTCRLRAGEPPLGGAVSGSGKLGRAGYGSEQLRGTGRESEQLGVTGNRGGELPGTGYGSGELRGSGYGREELRGNGFMSERADVDSVGALGATSAASSGKLPREPSPGWSDEAPNDRKSTSSSGLPENSAAVSGHGNLVEASGHDNSAAASSHAVLDGSPPMIDRRRSDLDAAIGRMAAVSATGSAPRKRRRRRRKNAGTAQPPAPGAVAAAAATTAAAAPAPDPADAGSRARAGAAAPEAAPLDGAAHPGDAPAGASPNPGAAAEPAAAPRKRRRRRGRRSAKAAARALLAGGDNPAPAAEAPAIPPRRVRRPLPVPPPRPPGPDASVLRPTRAGVIKMRGRTDKGRRWVQDTDLATAVNLVEEHAAVVINSYTIRRIYTNKSFRSYILTRDRYTCFFCGEYGDTIDHLVPRSKGGHTTPVNCVCACHLCNQSKASRDLDEFYEDDNEEA